MDELKDVEQTRQLSMPEPRNWLNHCGIVYEGHDPTACLRALTMHLGFVTS